VEQGSFANGAVGRRLKASCGWQLQGLRRHC